MLSSRGSEVRFFTNREIHLKSWSFWERAQRQFNAQSRFTCDEPAGWKIWTRKLDKQQHIEQHFNYPFIIQWQEKVCELRSFPSQTILPKGIFWHEAHLLCSHSGAKTFVHLCSCGNSPKWSRIVNKCHARTNCSLIGQKSHPEGGGGGYLGKTKILTCFNLHPSMIALFTYLWGLALHVSEKTLQTSQVWIYPEFPQSTKPFPTSTVGRHSALW